MAASTSKALYTHLFFAKPIVLSWVFAVTPKAFAHMTPPVTLFSVNYIQFFFICLSRMYWMYIKKRLHKSLFYQKRILLLILLPLLQLFLDILLRAGYAVYFAGCIAILIWRAAGDIPKRFAEVGKIIVAYLNCNFADGQ